MTREPSKFPIPIDRDAIEKAVAALLKWRGKNAKSHPAKQVEFLLMILTLKKIPTRQQAKVITLPIHHPLFDASNICLIFDDRPKSNLIADIVNRRIQEENLPITKVLKFSKLKSDHQSFEAKRRLCDSHEMFLADRRIIDRARAALGKQFAKKKKLPIEVDLESGDWKDQVQRVCRSAVMSMGAGTCCVVKLGTLLMEKHQLVENTFAAISAAGEAVPRKWGNVRSVHLKLEQSIALPVYESPSHEEESRLGNKRKIDDYRFRAEPEPVNE